VLIAGRRIGFARRRLNTAFPAAGLPPAIALPSIHAE